MGELNLGRIFRPERRIKLQFPEVGTHPRLPEGRNGLARGIYNRVAVAGRVSSEQIPSDFLWRLNALPPASGFSA